MHRYWCEEFEGDRSQTRQSADLCFRIFPPWFRFSIIDWDRCESWTLTNNHFNLQARESLESLRPSDAWVLTNGFHGNGWFRAIEPCQITLGNAVRLWFEVDVNWNSAWINITTESEESHILMSMRPPRGSSHWVRGRDRPPAVVFLREDGSPEPIVAPAPVATEESRSSTDPPPDGVEVTPTLSNHDNHDAFENAPTEIIEEVIAGVHMFMRPPIGGIPFSAIPRPIPNHLRSLVTQEPITLEALDPVGILGFGLGMELVRAINRVRFDEHHDTHAPPNHVVVPRPVPVIHRDGTLVDPPVAVESLPTITRPIEVVPPVVPEVPVFRPASPTIRLRPPPMLNVLPSVPPPVPVAPKPRPPDRPPPIIFRESDFYRPTAAQLVNFQVLRSVNHSFHPTLQPVTTLSANLLVPPVITRTGTVHPRLPNIDESSTSSESPPTPLRTTREGIRLEITPVAMVQRSQPEVVSVIPREHSLREPTHGTEDPETNPEA